MRQTTLIMIWLLLGTSLSHPCSYVCSETEKEQIKRSEVIFLGILKDHAVRGTDAVATITVLEELKGKAGKEITLYSEASDMCPVSFFPNTKQIFFVSRDKQKRLTVGLCDVPYVRDDQKDTLEKLERVRKATARYRKKP